MRPLDPRLLQWARATRTFLIVSVLLGTLTAVAIIAQAVLVASIIAEVFRGGADLAAVSDQIGQLAAVIAVRAVLAYLSDWTAFRASARAKSQLRMAVLEHVMALGPGYVESVQPGRIAQLTGRGIDALDAYFARYLPQLVLAVVVPVLMAAVVITQDVLAAVIIAITLPLIPVFMVLVGWYTRGQVDRQWRTLTVLSGHFLDVVAGLPTLKAFGRARAQAATIREVGDRYRRATMGVLRVSFLSSLVLELLATLSVAVVAVSIGLRLVNGDLDFATGLLVLILAPEAYLPVRMVGAQFHAAADGIEASSALLDILAQPLPSKGCAAPPCGSPGLELCEVTACYPGRTAAALRGLTLSVPPGRITALVGPSGAGKSTVLRLMLGLLEPESGRVAVYGGPGGRRRGTAADPVGLADIDLRLWRERIAWLPQDPALIAGTVADNIRLGRPDADEAEVAAAARAAALDDPDVLHQHVTDEGAGVSAGQRRRIGLARALLREAALVLLDEPSAALDPDTERTVVAAVADLRRQGRTVVLVAHRPALVDIADQVVPIPVPDPRTADHDNGPATADAQPPGRRSADRPLPGLPR